MPSPDIATTIDAAMKRAARNIIREIAKKGIVALKNILDRSGFAKSEYLDDYEVFAHIRGDEITFEIIVDFDALQFEDDATKKALEENAQQLQNSERTYGVRSNRAYTYVRDVRKPAIDKRKPARDARQPARDARKTSHDRLVGHEIALHAPRSARMTRQGKLSVTLRRSVRETQQKIQIPDGEFDGIIKEVMDKLSTIIASSFVPAIQEIVVDYVG